MVQEKSPSHSHNNAMMMKTKELSIDLSQKIIDLHKTVYKYSEISKRLVVKRSRVQYVINKFALLNT